MSLLGNLMVRHRGEVRRRSTPQQAERPSTIDDSGGLLPYLVQQDSLNEETSRIRKVIQGGMIHSTHLPDICPRQVALLRKTKVDFIHPKRIDSNNRLIWATGRAFEQHIRNQFINAFSREAIIGAFKCKCGANVHSKDFNGVYSITGHVVNVNRTCSHCGTHINQYDELPIILDDYHVILSPDFGYLNRQNKAVVVELKSINKEGFQALVEPEISHVRQVYLYHLAATLNGADMAPYIVIIYASKGWINTAESLPYKQFTVQVTDNHHVYEGNMRMLQVGRVVKHIDPQGNVSSEFDSGDGYPEGVCNDSGCPTARNCQVSGICFSLRRV